MTALAQHHRGVTEFAEGRERVENPAHLLLRFLFTNSSPVPGRLGRCWFRVMATAAEWRCSLREGTLDPAQVSEWTDDVVVSGGAGWVVSVLVASTR